MLSPDSKTTRAFIKLLEEWCAENKLSINVSKSGILRSGELSKSQPERFQLNGKPLQFLGEKDSDFENQKELEYLGTVLPQNGSWEQQIQKQLASARSALGQNSNFFREAAVPVALKIELAEMVVLSKLNYGAEIMHLTESQEKKLDSFQEKVFKTILHVPSYASGSAVRYILGRPALSTLRRTARVTNILRIKQMSPNTRLREIYDSQKWHNASLLFGGYEKDIRVARSDRRLSSVTENELHVALEGAPIDKAKKVVKKLSTEADISKTAHYLRRNHPELLHFNSTPKHPLWLNTPQFVGSHARWLTATVGAACDDHRDKHRQESMCKLCTLRPDTRVHRLVECSHPEVVKVRDDLYADIKRISPDSEPILRSLSTLERFAWLLSCGCSINKDPDPPENNRIPPRGSPFIAGESVSPIHGMKDPLTNLQSYLDFREIQSRHACDLQVYTDGSAPCKLAGYGAVIYKSRDHELRRSKPLYEASVEIGETTNNVAELEAVHDALRWIVKNCDNPEVDGKHIRVYTDSQYTREVLLAPNAPKHHVYLVESIKALGAKLRYDHALPVTIHWIPSHIELTAWGRLPIHGNCRADKLAEIARERSSSASTHRQTSNRRARLQVAISRSLAKLEKLYKTQEENPDGPSSDDFDSDAFQENSSSSFDT